ncbi:MAG: two-component sensor histidine kinase [Deltaproteobacteria bacterium]|nr:two-component sensor histidine kinase [Deltaproteobacteria bacterium]MBW1990708.1 two-component sensor histidine kinase [Deltaproteobacteria bacterium]
MFRWLRKKLKEFFSTLREFPDYAESPERYKLLRRNIVVLMLVVTILPLTLMGLINHYLYRQAMHDEIVRPLKILVNKTKHSFELFLAERLSTVSFIASSYTCSELADNNNLSRIFSVMKKEFIGVVDLGFLDPNGVQVSYDGPYKLRGKNYKDHDWYKETRVRGAYVSDVFLGYRKLPHIVMAVERSVPGVCLGCVLRATIDTNRFMELIASMRLEPDSDAFLLNKKGVFQTPSKFYGQVLETFPMPLPPLSYEPNVVETEDPNGREILLTYAYFESLPFILMVIKPRGLVMQAWYTLKTEAFFIFVAGVLLIFLVVFKLTDKLVKHLEESDLRREAAYREIQESSKLASIGRLAAGVAHEINNPLAIINEKAGLIKDLTQFSPDFPQKDKLLSLTGTILQSVDRCRTITQRLLGFARRMEVTVESLNLNEVIEEVLSFVEKEALHRNIELHLSLAQDLPRIASDRGQLQQVFLNIINNAFEAVEDGGRVTITSFEVDDDTVAVSIQDNGQGMTQEVMNHIFEPFFTTKRGKGTGLGLSITYGIVKKLGGDIKVASKLGEGTTFTVFLPKKAQARKGE